MIETIASYISILEFIAKLSVFGKKAIDKALLESSHALQRSRESTEAHDIWEVLRRNVNAQAGQSDAESVVDAVVKLRDIILSAIPGEQSLSGSHALPYGTMMKTVLSRVADSLAALGCFDLFGVHSTRSAPAGSAYRAVRAYRELGISNPGRRLSPGYLIMPQTKDGVRSSVLGKESAAVKNAFGILTSGSEIYLARGGVLHLYRHNKGMDVIIDFLAPYDASVRLARISNAQILRLSFPDLETLLRGVFSDFVSYHKKTRREVNSGESLLREIAWIKGPLKR